MKPLMTDKPVGIKNVLLVGNSFMFYNCGVNGMINGFAKAKHRDLVITLVGIGGASLYWHDVKSYFATECSKKLQNRERRYEQSNVLGLSRRKDL